MRTEWSPLEAEVTTARSKSPWRCTARITAARKAKNWAIWCVVAPIQQVHVFDDERPIQMLARAVDAFERFPVREAGHAVFLGGPLQLEHYHALAVHGDVRILIHGGDFALGGRDFVVAHFDRNTELVQLPLRLQHAGRHAVRNAAEILVLELLHLWRSGAEERPASVEQIRPAKKKLRSIGKYSCPAPAVTEIIPVPEKREDPFHMRVQRLKRLQQWDLFVQRVARP